MHPAKIVPLFLIPVIVALSCKKTRDADKPPPDVQIATGGYHTLVIKTDHTLWATGRNTEGQLGDGTITNKNLLVLKKQQ